ncbi:hypothetical protein ACFCXR_03355 [Streptomyces noursei]|uniref:hypothetical protein n=1 Tax=Streptomyces noursei TaxID=1971 RepID=UPI0035D99CA2
MARRTTARRPAVHLAGVGCVGCVLTAAPFDAILVALFSGRVPVLVAVSLVPASWTAVAVLPWREPRLRRGGLVHTVSRSDRPAVLTAAGRVLSTLRPATNAELSPLCDQPIRR